MSLTPSIVPDAILRVLKPYQVAPAGQLLRALCCGAEDWGYPGAVDLSDVGTGKSYMDAAAALATGLRPVVLCPTVGESGWRETFQRFGVDPHYVGTYDGVRGNWRREIYDHGQWMHAGEIILILDEAQALRGEDSLTSRVIADAITQRIPIICASATLAISPLELRIAGQVTGLHQGGDDWTRFKVEHGCEFDDDEERWKWRRSMHHLDAIHRTLIPQRGCRVRKADMGDQPGTTINVLPLAVPQGAQIEREWQDALTTLQRMESQGEHHTRILNLRRAARTRIWKASELALVPAVADRARRDLDDGRSVVMFFSFTDSRMAMGRALGTSAGFYGGQNAKHRAHWQREFQTNRQHVLLNNIGAGGSSVSLHDTTGERPRVSYIFPCDNPVKMGQAPGRIDRSGGVTPSVQWIPCVKSTLSERMVTQVARKLQALACLNDGIHQL